MLSFSLLGYSQITPIPEPSDDTLQTLGSAPQKQEETSSTARSEWLPSFDRVVVSAGVDIKFVQVPDTQAPKIIYDTKGSYTTRFEAEVRDKVLYVREKIDGRRPDRTTVTVHYNHMESLSVSECRVSFENGITQDLFDLVIGARASVVAEFNILDLNMELSGDSNALISGDVRYLNLSASTGKVDFLGTQVMSAKVYAQAGAEVKLNVTDRLEGRANTGASILYKGKPRILRMAKKFLAREIAPMN